MMTMRRTLRANDASGLNETVSNKEGSLIFFLRGHRISSRVAFLLMCGLQAFIFLIVGAYMGSSLGCLTQPVQNCNSFDADVAANTKRFTKSQWLEQYKAAMLLGGCADAIAYNKGNWEFQLEGIIIHKELKGIGGLSKIRASMPDWIVSDDTVMHLATAEAIVEYESRPGEGSREELYQILAKHYLKSYEDMNGRAPGTTCLESAQYLNPLRPKGYVIPFNKRGGGCGAAMRAMCIGMYFPGESQLDDLIAISIESGRMTHNNPTGYLGALASALFTHCAIQGYPIQSWGAKLMESLDKAWKYVESQGRDIEENKEAWNYFHDSWEKYLKLRGIQDGCSMPQFPNDFGVEERDKFYKSLSFRGWGGSSGHDAPMIAYDALLGCEGNWEKLADRAFFHGGDSDSTATIAATWYGIMHGYQGVPRCNYENLEYRKRLEQAGEDIFKVACAHLPIKD